MCFEALASNRKWTLSKVSNFNKPTTLLEARSMNIDQLKAIFMNIDRKIIVRELLFVTGFLIVLVAVSMVALAVKSRSRDGPGRFFSGGPLVAARAPC